MLSFFVNWKRASEIGAFMHEISAERGSGIPESACHSIVKAYGWKRTSEFFSFLQHLHTLPEAFKYTALEVARDVYGNQRGSEYAQDAALQFLKATWQLPPLEQDDGPAATRYRKEVAKQPQGAEQV